MFASAKNFSRNVVGAAGTLFFAGLCIAGATAPAQAHVAYGVNDNGNRVAYVSYADLDLGSSAGNATLNGRLRIAAKNVCQSNGVAPWASVEDHKCFTQALKATRNATMAAIAADKVAG